MPTPKLRTAMYDTQSLPLRKYIAGLLEARGLQCRKYSSNSGFNQSMMSAIMRAR